MKQKISRKELIRALAYAVMYVGKGCAEKAYDGCVVSGESALDYLESVLNAAKVSQ